MTVHFSKDFIVRPYATLINVASKKDDTKQLAIRVRVIPKNKKKEKRYDITVKDMNGKVIRLTPKQFKTNRYSNTIKRRLSEIDYRVMMAVFNLLEEKPSFKPSDISKYVYETLEVNDNYIHSYEMVDDPEILNALNVDEPVPKDVVNKISAMNTEDFLDAETGEQIDIEDIVSWEESDFYNRIEIEKVEKMDFEERYEKGHYDKQNIFDLFGFCWTTNKQKGTPFVPDSYRSLILRMADYRYNKTPSENIEDFNENWVDDFIIYLKEEGYASDVHPRNYTPFNIHDYTKDLVLSERKIYDRSSFDKQVKHLTRYIDLLQEQKKLSRKTVDTRDINTSSYVKKNTSPYTRSSHALLQSEIDHVLNHKFTDGKLERTRVMFLLQLFSGGLRNDEFFNKYFKLKESNGVFYFSYYAHKTSTIEENPLIDGYSDVLLNQIDYKLPTFLKVSEYRDNLKLMAKEMNLNRDIRYQVMKATGETEVFVKPIYELINPYWCRKSFVSLCTSLGWTKDEISEFTGHADSTTVRFYSDKLSLDEKRKIVSRHK